MDVLRLFPCVGLVLVAGCPPSHCNDASCEGEGREGEGQSAEGEGEGAEGEGGEGEGNAAEGEGGEGEGVAGEGEGEGCTGPCVAPSCFGNAEWCWETPVAPSQSPATLLATSSTDVWIGIGTNDNAAGGVVHYDGASFTASRIDVGGRSSGVEQLWGSAANDVYGVGRDLLHFDGAAWTPLATDVSLHDVTGTSANDVWAVGDAARVIHFDGTSLVDGSIPGALDLVAVAARGVGDVFASDGAAVFHFHNGAWAPITGAIAPTSLAADATLVVGLSIGGVSVNADDFRTATFAPPATSIALDGAHVWATGEGVSVAPRTLPVTLQVTQQSTIFVDSVVRAGLDGNAWFAGNPFDGPLSAGLELRIGNPQGTTPSRVAFAPLTQDVGIHAFAYDVPNGAGAIDVHAFTGKLVRGSDGVWRDLENPPPADTFERFVATADDDVWAFSPALGLSHFDGASWSTPLPAPAKFFPGSPCATAASDAFAFGDVVAHYDGTSWTTTPASFVGASNAFCTATREAFVVPGFGLARVSIDASTGALGETVVGLGDTSYTSASAAGEEAWLNTSDALVRVDATGFIVAPYARDAQNRPLRPDVVAGVSASDFWRASSAFAVLPALVHVQNGVETSVALPTPPGEFFSSAAAFPNTVLLFDPSGLVVTATGTSATATSAATQNNDFNRFSAVSPTEAYCVDSAGDIMRFDGAGWTPWLAGHGATFVSAIGPDDVWAVATTASGDPVAERVTGGVIDAASAALGDGIGGQIVGIDDVTAYALDQNGFHRFDGVVWSGFIVPFELNNSLLARRGDEAVISFGVPRSPPTSLGLLRVNAGGVVEIPNVSSALSVKVDASAGASPSTRVALDFDGRGYRIDGAGKTTALSRAETSTFFERTIGIVDQIGSQPCTHVVELRNGAMVDVDTTFPVCALAIATTPAGHEIIVGDDGAIVHRAP